MQIGSQSQFTARPDLFVQVKSTADLATTEVETSALFKTL